MLQQVLLISWLRYNQPNLGNLNDQMGLLPKSSQAFRRETYWLLLRNLKTLNYQ